MIKKLLILLGCSSSFVFNSQAQDIIQSKKYPVGAFQYPLDLPPSTAGSFGELRSMHFHSGLDFRTNRQTGYPVHAAMYGYVSRLRVQTGGFGNAVYLTHPNGYTTVYGHLDHLVPELAEAVRKYQYDHQSWEVDFRLQPFQFPVTKGQLIAISGNTGASGGPHLHFEIRDSLTEETINPQLFGLTIADKISPAISSIAVYQLNGHPFSENTPRSYYSVSGAAGNYHLTKPETLFLSGDIGFGISTSDQNSSSVNRNGIYSLELKLDGRTVYTFAVERFAFDQTHAINAYIDYPLYLKTRRTIQKCFILPGSKITVYPQSENRGIISFRDTMLHDVEYVVKDIAGNTSNLKLKVQASIPKDRPIVNYTGTKFSYDKRNEFSNGPVKVIVEPGNLYDDVDFNYSVLPQKPGAYSAVHHIHNRLTPIHANFELWIKPDASIGNLTNKAVIVNTVAGSVGGIYQDGYVKAKPAAFGDFHIKVDTTAPVITPINIKQGANLKAVRSINLRASDDLSGIRSITAKIDGKWVLLQQDYRTRIFRHNFEDGLAAGKHIFEVTVVDNKDNSRQYTAEFYR
ncbi:M23 family metallopeptidase [Mucilaginibacter daejeonensis]|uniref:M23 family metallopeptidase n=1 Tax=Mucilaginibacter daejeonensis TaxID=398049 RepID=UPI001D17C762|nr:M23 family metallopeptidase [Mucilaginibacter daejeonensis]UEG51964.1 M23 family metallopeptidase [Mucilaginibacter daejeonensis]